MTKYQSTICKGIGILLMLYHHLFLNVERIEKYDVSFWPMSQETGHQIAVIFKVCVAIFVFVTGYGYYKKYENEKDGLRTVLARILNLMFKYWFIFLLFFIIGIFAKQINVYECGNALKSVIYVIVDFGGLAYFFDTPTLNPTFWYMSLALLFIILCPLLKIINSKIVGIALVLIAILLGNKFYINLRIQTVFIYLTTLECGMLCSKYKVFEKCEKLLKKYLNIDLIISLVVLIGLAYLRDARYTFFFDTIIAMSLCYLIFRTCQSEKERNVLYNFGKCSTNAFLVHTFIYKMYFTDLIFKPRYYLMIWGFLVVATWIVSILLEKIKKIIKYTDYSILIVKKVQKKV